MGNCFSCFSSRSPRSAAKQSPRSFKYATSLASNQVVSSHAPVAEPPEPLDLSSPEHPSSIASPKDIDFAEEIPPEKGHEIPRTPAPSAKIFSLFESSNDHAACIVQSSSSPHPNEDDIDPLASRPKLSHSPSSSPLSSPRLQPKLVNSRILLPLPALVHSMPNTRLTPDDLSFALSENASNMTLSSRKELFFAFGSIDEKQKLIEDENQIISIDLTRQVPSTDETILHYAAKNGHVSLLKLLLSESVQFPLQAVDSNGESVFHYAAKRGQDSSLAFFISLAAPQAPSLSLSIPSRSSSPCASAASSPHASSSSSSSSSPQPSSASAPSSSPSIMHNESNSQVSINPATKELILMLVDAPSASNDGSGMSPLMSLMQVASADGEVSGPSAARAAALLVEAGANPHKTDKLGRYDSPFEKARSLESIYKAPYMLKSIQTALGRRVVTPSEQANQDLEVVPFWKAPALFASHEQEAPLGEKKLSKPQLAAARRTSTAPASSSNLNKSVR